MVLQAFLRIQLKSKSASKFTQSKCQRMFSKIFSRDKERRRRFAHIAAGLVILVHSYEKYDSGHDSYKMFAVAGIIFLIIALLHPVIEKKAPWIDGVFFVIESVLSAIVAIDYFHMGKKALPVAYVCLSIFQLFIAFKKSKKGMQLHKTNH
jgi:hypothetical protein